MFNLLSMFETIQIPNVSENVRFATHKIPEYEMHRLGKDAEGKPGILISIANPTPDNRPAPIVLEHLTVQYDINCRISQGIEQLEGIFTVIHCAGQEIALHTHFLHVASAVIASLGSSPSHSDVMEAVTRLVELFRALKSLPKKPVQGLWAELFIIARAKKPAFLVNAWHSSLNDRYDFNTGTQRIEVKSASGRTRKHHFSLEQLQPPNGTDVLIASVYIERSGAGSSISQLIDEIRSYSENDLDSLLHLDHIVNMTLGTNWRSASEERFDRELAEHSLSFFDVHSIPTIAPDLRSEISNVHFMADITAVSPINLKQYRNKGGLFQAVQRK